MNLSELCIFFDEVIDIRGLFHVTSITCFL